MSLRSTVKCFVYGAAIATVSLILLTSFLTPSSNSDLVVVESRTSNKLTIPIAPLNESTTTSTTVNGGATEANTENTADSETPSTTVDHTVYVPPTEHGKIVTTEQETVTLSFYEPPQLPPEKDWSPGLCRDFIGHSYQLTSPVCSRITCHGSSFSHSTGTCTMTGVAVRPQRLYNALKHINIKKMTSSNDIITNSKAAWLVKQPELGECRSPNFKDVDTYFEHLDYSKPFVKMASLFSIPNTQCTRWIKGTTFFYIGMENHIYFKFLAWHNLHRSLLSHKEAFNNYTIIRLPEGNNTFLFPEFESALFNGITRLQDYYEDVLCFERLVLSPWAYASPAFRCRIEKIALKRKCLQCKGRDIESDYKSFRRRVLAACGIRPNEYTRKKVLVIERRQYNRRIGDQAKSFTRVWENSKELIDQLKLSLPHYNITGILAEQLSICEQIMLAHDADVLIGMHGAGMVHLWWTHQDAKIVEIVPKSQRGNVAFKTLATFLGQSYKEVTRVTENKNIVNVNTKEIVNTVLSLVNNR